MSVAPASNCLPSPTSSPIHRHASPRVRARKRRAFEGVVASYLREISVR